MDLRNPDDLLEMKAFVDRKMRRLPRIVMKDKTDGYRGFLRSGGIGLVFEDIKIYDPEITAAERSGKQKKIPGQEHSPADKQLISFVPR